MASTSSRVSNVFVMLLVSRRSLIALLLTLALVNVSCRTVPHRQRIFSPCSGSSPIDFEDVQTRIQTVVDPVQLQRDLNHIARKTSLLRTRVNNLKNLYVSKRFKSDRTVTEMDQSGFKIEGMPSTRPATGGTTDAQIDSTVHQAYDDLARVAVFIEQARIGEILATNEHITFEDKFLEIEDHHEEGLYLILCSVHRVLHTLGKTFSTTAHNEILNLRVTEVDRNALRHARDYLVLRDFDRILERLAIEFASLDATRAS